VSDDARNSSRDALAASGHEFVNNRKKRSDTRGEKENSILAGPAHNNRRHITQHVAPPTTTNQGRKKEKLFLMVIRHAPLFFEK
jgi:hypothetical protein